MQQWLCFSLISFDTLPSIKKYHLVKFYFALRWIFPRLKKKLSSRQEKNCKEQTSKSRVMRVSNEFLKMKLNKFDELISRSSDSDYV